MSKQQSSQSSHQLLAAAFAAPTWEELRAQADARGLTVMQLQRERLQAEWRSRQEDAERMRALSLNPIVRRALREGRLPTPEELASAESPEEAAPSRPFDAGAFQAQWHRTFGGWPSSADQQEERARMMRGERSILDDAPPSAGRNISPPRKR
jgi:hypothetical protein